MASEVIEKDIYGGKYHITHNPNAKGRAPRYRVNDTKPIGVTTVLGKTLSKDLMQWAVDCACEYLRDKLPVVTEKDLKQAARAYITKRDFGSSTGTEAHALVELFLKEKGNELATALEDSSKEAEKAYVAFVEWFNAVKPEVLGVEEVVYSPDLEYAGTYDCMLRINGLNYLCDFKTTNISKLAPKGVYADMFLQLGAYSLAHEEQRVYEEKQDGTDLFPVEGLMIISAKKNGQLDIVTNDDVGLTVGDCMQHFAFIMMIYRFMRETERRLLA